MINLGFGACLTVPAGPPGSRTGRGGFGIYMFLLPAGIFYVSKLIYD